MTKYTIPFILGSFLVATPAPAQNCKYVKEFKDPFTNVVTKGAQMTIGNPIAGKDVLFQIQDGKLYLGLGIVFNDLGTIPFKKGDKISFKLANGEVIEISPAADVEPRAIRVMNVEAQQWFVLQEVPRKVYEQLASSPITAIKYHLKNDFFIAGIKDRQTSKIMENAACMLTLVN